MTSKLIASAVLAAAALTSVAASADTFNPYLWDQMKAPATKTRAQVRAELLEAPKDAAATASLSSDNGAAVPQIAGAPAAEKTVAAPRASGMSVKTGGQ